ncbi:hypothetical protein ACWGKQ_12855 [Streptomyces sp. NPDC054770]
MTDDPGVVITATLTPGATRPIGPRPPGRAPGLEAQVRDRTGPPPQAGVMRAGGVTRGRRALRRLLAGVLAVVTGMVGGWR